MSVDTVARPDLDRDIAILLPKPQPTDAADNVSAGNHGGAFARSELKFPISNDMAVRISKAASLLMNRDPYVDPVSNTYEVHTIYLDSPDMAIYRKSLNREADRFKLRIRFYDGDASAPVFLEIKQNWAGRGTKTRLKVDREAAGPLFASNNDWDFANVELPPGGFWEAVRRFKAKPLIHIAYEREAFVGKNDPGTRLTLDRQIRCQPAPSSLTTEMREPVHIWQGKVVLEIKFTGRIPPYLEELIHFHGLVTAKVSKYLESVSSHSIVVRPQS
jgi:hypothetical protein